MQPLSGLDASFLYLEDARVPMHVGSVLVFEGSMQFEDFRRTMASRIHMVPRMQQRLLMVPLGLGKPYWIDDPEFDLDLHLQHVALPRPGGWRQLRELAARIFAVPLDRSRPLWEMSLVEGLDTLPQVPPGSVALVNKVHHAAIDGVSGADMMSILFDVTREPGPVPPPPARDSRPVPNELQVLRRTARKIAGKPARIPRLVRDGVKAWRAGTAVRVQGLDVPPAPFTAPATPFNQVVSARRGWNSALLSLDRVKAIKRAMDCTLNDVVLAICAGALRRYLADKDALPEDPLVSMVPVSTRAASAHGDMGNQVSAMLVQLATHIADPIERLRDICHRARSSKAYQNAVGASTLAELAEFIPFGVAGQASRVYSRFRVAERHRPLFNLVITNVPGPQVDLYVAGHRLLASMGMAPIVDGMGLIITVLSYNGVLSLSPTSSPAVMPDIDVFARHLREEANRLEAAVARVAAERPAVADNGHAAAAASAFFDRVRDHLAGAPAGTGTFQFHVTGPDERHWIVALADRSVTEGEAERPDAILTIRDEHLALIAGGDLDPQMALVQGKLRVDGDMAAVIAFGALLPRVVAAQGASAGR